MPSPSIEEIKAQIAALQAQAAEISARERAEALAHARELVKRHELTQKEIFGAKAVAPLAPRYRDPKTGATWSGRGKKPAWVVAALAEGRALGSLSA